MACWTKNEGLVFLPTLAIAIAWRGGRRAALWFGAGALPALALAAVFKIAIAPGVEGFLPSSAGDAMSKLGDPSRWLAMLAGFGSAVWRLGQPWAHPILLLAIAGFAIGFLPRSDARARAWLLIAPLGLLAADFAAFLITRADLRWHLDTSDYRLIAQPWPSILFVFFLLLRMPVPRRHGDRKRDRATKRATRPAA